MVDSAVLLLALYIAGGTTIVVKDGDGKPVRGAKFQVSKSEDFDAQHIIAARGREVRAGEIVTDEITQEKIKDVRTLHARAWLNSPEGASLFGPHVAITCNGRVPARIELQLDPHLRTCVPATSPALCCSPSRDLEWPCRSCSSDYRCYCEEAEYTDHVWESELGAAGADVARFAVVVPQDAIVFVNGRRTMKTGSQRDYYSVGLKHGYDYRYVVRAQIVRDGNVIEDTREVVLRLGDNECITFELSSDNVTRPAAAP